jgi:Raf kinase inhibitor-like YbhB/YbcL family protein
LVLIIEDPDAPQGTWTHWVIYNIPPKTKIISENSFPQDSTSGLNSWEKSKYGGPCPPSGQHRYFFKLYALDIIDETGTLRDRKSVEDLMKGHILAQTQIIGVYSKQ